LCKTIFEIFAQTRRFLLKRKWGPNLGFIFAQASSSKEILAQASSSKEILAQAKMETYSGVHFCSNREILAQAKIVLEVDLLSSSFSLKQGNFHSSKEILA